MALNRRQELAVGVGLAVFCLFSATPGARAQISADPYKPYNAQYDQYIYPTYPTGAGVAPNQSLLSGRGGSARSFQRYLQAEDEMDRAASSSSVMPQRRGVGVPYYSAYREYDQSYNRLYTPNKDADKRYLASRRTRDEIYSQYLAETDPKQKALRLKEYQEYNLRALRDLNERRNAPPARSTSRSKPGATPPLPPIPGTAGRRPEPSAAGARSRAPARPSSTDILRRSESLDTATPPRPAAPTSAPRRPAAATDTTP